MSEIKVVRLSGGPHSHTCRFELDGREMPGVQSVEMRANVNSLLTVYMTCIAREGIEFEGEIGKLHVIIRALPGYEVDQLPREGGGWVWKVRKVERNDLPQT